MNIIIEGPDASGKTTIANKLAKDFNFTITHYDENNSTYTNLMNALDSDNNIYDRFHISEMVFPVIYNRSSELDFDKFNEINTKIFNNNDIIIILYTSNINILNSRLISRNEYNYLKEIEAQNNEYIKYAYIMDAYEYSNYIFVDISRIDAYENLYNKVVERLKCA